LLKDSITAKTLRVCIDSNKNVKLKKKKLKETKNNLKLGEVKTNYRNDNSISPLLHPVTILETQDELQNDGSVTIGQGKISCSKKSRLTTGFGVGNDSKNNVKQHLREKSSNILNRRDEGTNESESNVIPVRKVTFLESLTEMKKYETKKISPHRRKSCMKNKALVFSKVSEEYFDRNSQNMKNECKTTYAQGS
jgi:hypothetical protein